MPVYQVQALFMHKNSFGHKYVGVGHMLCPWTHYGHRYVVIGHIICPSYKCRHRYVLVGHTLCPTTQFVHVLTQTHVLWMWYINISHWIMPDILLSDIDYVIVQFGHQPVGVGDKTCPISKCRHTYIFVGHSLCTITNCVLLTRTHLLCIGGYDQASCTKTSRTGEGALLVLYMLWSSKASTYGCHTYGLLVRIR